MTFSLKPLVAAFGLIFAAGHATAAQQTAYLAGGCFWCVEADFEKVRGVGDVVSGFAGGATANPTYGNSGDHLEAVRVPFDDTQISYRQIYDMFLRSIDPLDAGGQFCDRGLEYTTAIFYETAAQRQAAEAAKAAAEQQLGRDIVTKIMPVNEFSPVGEYHQDYYKSQDRVAFTRFGVAVPKNEAYVRYRQGCGRDARVKAVWGDAAPFVK
ncbi:Peptide methionine sulfoxide reductase MsrA 2 [Rhodobacteraceae bacterium THAF1]|uniref:peptide-methionine (S)-S-oxide reductase MsrA n=1 Tax=Palleronia sp. THAF1 TaxID=2587842 RepID=UPI000F4113C5|nr:peptide-methionine (S)-S-oxide reductase MsrA [Palleronia sp. THAF1]QFU10173.1 Peptide methionine sulfoxide reductase MsrA 2 [Palleronia sp. THAF1]VDC16922.1 Peptide methionine sulfoxide reductase MsrA 2 [Rhodobacteraceae bacterium THAF1]